MAFHQIFKARIIGVVAVQLAVPVHHGVHRMNAQGLRVNIIAVRDHQLLVGNGHIDGLKIVPFHKIVRFLLGGQRAQIVNIIADHLVDHLAVAVPQLCADQSVFHKYVPLFSFAARQLLFRQHRTIPA